MTNPEIARDAAVHTRAFLNHLIVEKGRSKNTIASYKRDLEKLTLFAQARGRGIKDLDRNDLDALVIAARTGGTRRYGPLGDLGGEAHRHGSRALQVSG
ncbi:site-specific integrase [Timonella senegalensis]|uniref:site-specific integrase n=1 Tax=Timonella senegalensis TaxID=1465825 RepID=UPI0002E33ACD|nr:site-specific integrase [Timonella senegalensis]